VTAKWYREGLYSPQDVRQRNTYPGRNSFKRETPHLTPTDKEAHGFCWDGILWATETTAGVMVNPLRDDHIRHYPGTAVEVFCRCDLHLQVKETAGPHLLS
jgi:hypothetical protein